MNPNNTPGQIFLALALLLSCFKALPQDKRPADTVAGKIKPDTSARTFKTDTVVKTLKTVEVKSARPLIKREADRIVYDLQADPESKIYSLLEIMRKIPYLSLDANGHLLFKGNSSFKILVNGKTSGLLDQNPDEILRSMPASTIERIEVITTPPSRYDAEGLAGIINIITVKKVEDGYAGTVNGSERFPMGGPRLGFSVTARQDRWGLSAYGSGSESKTPATHFFTGRNTDGTDPTTLAQNGSRSSHENNGYFGTEISYAIDSLQLLFGQVSWNGGRSNGTTDQVSVLSDPGGILQGYNLNNASHGRGNGTDASLNYQLGFKKDKSKMLTLSYRYFTYGNNRFNSNNLFDKIAYDLPDYRQSDATQSHEQSAQADFTKSFRGVNMEAGVKGIFRDNKSNFQYLGYDTTSGSYIPDPDQTNQFTSRQDVYSVYNSYQYSSKKWDYKAGVRVEETITNADFISTHSGVKQDYFNIIPSAVINRRFGTSSSINLGFTQRIKRPGINRLNPYVDRSNPDFETTGNPALRPATLNDIQLGYGFSKKVMVNVSLDYGFGNKLDLPVSVYDSVTKITKKTYQNTGKARRIGFDYNIGFSLTRNWKWTINGNLAWFDINGQVGGGSVTLKRITYYAGVTTNYSFTKGWQANASLSLNSRNPVDLQSISNAYTNSSFSVSKNILDGKYAFSAAVNNAFTPYRFSNIGTTGPDFDGTSTVREYFRAFSFSVNYRFGKQKLSIRKNKKGIDNNDVSN